MASEWQGGSNFVLVRRGSGTSRHGGVGDGSAKKKFGDAGMRNRIRFNPNVTRNSSPSCVVMAQSKLDKTKYDYHNRPQQVYRSSLDVRD